MLHPHKLTIALFSLSRASSGLCVRLLPLLQMSDKKKSKKVESASSSGSKKVVQKEIVELQHGGKVSRSGTKGSAKAAETREAIAVLQEAIGTLSLDEKKNNVIKAFNRVVKNYDGVIKVRHCCCHCCCCCCCCCC